MRFMGITARTSELLREFWEIAEPALPDILDGFYRHVTGERQLAAMIGNNIPRLKRAQGTHWARLFNGRFDHEYMAGVRAIGMVHNKIGLEPRWYIGAYNFVLNKLVSLAIRRYRWKAGHLSELLAAVNCAVMLDMEIAISVYQEAMLAEREKRQEKLCSAIESFDGRIRTVVETVGGSARSLQDAANGLASSASQSTQQSTAVAGASEEASANVQAVAASTEELTSSIREIGRQVSESTRVARMAVDQADRSGTTIQGLAKAAQRIGDVVELISSIAAQTVPRPECHDRGSSRRRGWPRLRCRRVRGQGSCRANSESDRRDWRTYSVDPGGDKGIRRSDTRHRWDHRLGQRDCDGHRSCGRRARGRDGRDCSKCPASRPRHAGRVQQHLGH